MIKQPLVLLLAVASIGAVEPHAGDGVVCQNKAAEVRCADGSCSIATDSFAPMRLEFTNARGRFCAASQCFEGTVVSRYDAKSYDYYDLALKLKKSGRAETTEVDDKTVRVGVMYRPQFASALVTWEDYAQPMTCEAQTGRAAL